MTLKEINEKALSRLSKIEGQVKGVSRMIGEGRYCVDILTQIAAADSALKEVRGLILKRHLNTCVSQSLLSKNKKDKQEKIDELITLFSKFSK